MKKLFMITIGGKTDKSNIEVHDIRFVASQSIEGTYESLKSTWFGTEKSLHIDRYQIINQVDGYDISLSDKASDIKLYMVNLGGNEKASYLEWHKNLLIASRSKSEAIDLATKAYKDIKDLHLDNIVDINDVLQGQEKIHLKPSETVTLNKEFIGYMKIR
ncbi:DUF1543 domain-containing protein [Acidaminobacter sp. JC074]|uniref:DUF1543 domain-containing protein n=1 Tax=Acidaminobacter sp. JC074 TaxID=2530199 RepID=UPI001F0CF839|nr:DUF1543 domain-containing protein [Acidaminobacter sp. JC074]MCH4886594.1 DUF1543 domain-containing protein [Acidaminobacter sp. JC074]